MSASTTLSDNQNQNSALTKRSRARTTFDSSIQDAEVLLAHFDSLNTKPPPDNLEVLKRAGLVMALTAWETYVEDRAREEVHARLNSDSASPLAKVVIVRLEADLKRFHNPNSDKTRQLFSDYLEIDVTEHWEWANVDSIKAKKTLDDLTAIRGDAVHRSKPPRTDIPAPHLVKREDLDKAIRFLKCLVDATEKSLQTQ
jgi:hypothetical protein